MAYLNHASKHETSPFPKHVLTDVKLLKDGVVDQNLGHANRIAVLKLVFAEVQAVDLGCLKTSSSEDGNTNTIKPCITGNMQCGIITAKKSLVLPTFGFSSEAIASAPSWPI